MNDLGGKDPHSPERDFKPMNTARELEIQREKRADNARMQAEKDEREAQAKFEDIKALDAEIRAVQADLDAQPEGVKLTADGHRTEGPDGLPTAAECADAVAGAPPPLSPPGW